MAITRKATRNIAVVLSGTPVSSSEFDLKAAYLKRHVPSIGSHYVVLGDGDVVKARPHEQHGNVSKLYNKDSVFIEVMGPEDHRPTAAQAAAVKALIDHLKEIYTEAEELDLTL